MLNDYFHALSPLVAGQLVLIILGFDVIGNGLVNLVTDKQTSWFRSAHWIIGMGLFVSIWFVIHFFVPYLDYILWLLLFVLGLIFFRWYQKRFSVSDLLATVVWFEVFVLLSLPLIKYLFVQISLPPFAWDEMAYHFYSPAQVISERNWDFSNPGFYNMMPRLLETLFVATFAMSKTYVIARCLQLLLIVSVIVSVSRFLAAKNSWLVAVIYQYLAVNLNMAIILASTTGYIDAGAGGLTVLSILLLFQANESKNKKIFYLSVIFMALSLGIKYSNVAAVLALMASAGFVFLLRQRQKVVKYLVQNQNNIFVFLLTSLVLWLVFGGYWYLKNLILTGDPVFPFLSGQGSENLQNWGYTQFKLSNFKTIITAVFTSFELYQISLLSISIAILMTLNKKRIHYTVWILMVILVEVLLVQFFSPFYPRFFYHWLLLVPLLLVSGIDLRFEKIKEHHFSQLLISFLLLLLVFHFSAPIIRENKDTNLDIKNILDDDWWYATGKHDFEGWLQKRWTGQYSYLKWCDQRPEMTQLLTSDPEMIWLHPGLTRIFLTKCNFKIIELSNDLSASASAELLFKNNQGYYVSAADCGSQIYEPFKEDVAAKKMYDLNQAIICKVKKTSDYIYLIGQEN